MQNISLLVLLFAVLWTTVSAGWMQPNKHGGSQNSVNFKRNLEAYRRVQDRILRSDSFESEESNEDEERRVMVDGSNLNQRMPRVNQFSHKTEKLLRYDNEPAIEKRSIKDPVNVDQLDNEDCKLCKSEIAMEKLGEILTAILLKPSQEELQNEISAWLHRIKLHESRYIVSMNKCKKKVYEVFERLRIAKITGTLKVQDRCSLPHPGIGTAFMMTDSEFRENFESMVEFFKDSGNQTSNGTSISKSSFYQEKSGNFEHQNSIDESILKESDASTPFNSENSIELENSKTAGKQDTLGEDMTTSQSDEESSPLDDANTKISVNHESTPEANEVITKTDIVD